MTELREGYYTGNGTRAYWASLRQRLQFEGRVWEHRARVSALCEQDGLADPDVPNRQHIHTVVRTPNGNDYGKGLLRQHYAQHPH